jgi:hypothetical protein
VKNAPVPTFAGISAPSFNFDTLIDGTRSTPFIYELDLSTARSFAAGTAVQIKITGNCMLIDAAPDVGNAYLIFEGVQDNSPALVRAPIYVQPGFVTRMPFANVYIANAAQPGKKLRIIYGVDIDFQMMFPGRMATVEQGHEYNWNFYSTATLAIGGVETALLPATNVNGLVLHRGQVFSTAAGLTRNSLVAKTGAAPVAPTDGDILWCETFNNTGFSDGLFARPLNVRPGYGLYWINEATAQSVAQRNLIGSLL